MTNREAYVFGWVFGLTAMRNEGMIPRVSAGDLK